MGLEKEKSRRQFGPNDLGILDSTPSRALRILVELGAISVNAPMAGLFIFDDTASELFLNSSVGLSETAQTKVGIPLTGSLASIARGQTNATRISDLKASPFDASVERLRFGAQAYLGAVVRGPANEPIGVLAAMRRKPYNWTFREAKLIGDAAYLVSQQIMLKASFETLRIMSAERRAKRI